MNPKLIFILQIAGCLLILATMLLKIIMTSAPLVLCLVLLGVALICTVTALIGAKRNRKSGAK